MPGPAPTPTKLKLLRNNPGKRKLNRAEPKPTTVKSVPAAPVWLGRLARNEWRRVARELVALRMLSTVDLSLLSIYCCEVERYRDAQAFVVENGSSYVIRDKDGAVRYVAQFPQVAIARAAADAVRKLASEFGFSPASRSRIQVADAPADVSLVDSLRDAAHKRA